MTPPRLLVIGLGAMGRRRVRDGLALGCEVAVWRSHAGAEVGGGAVPAVPACVDGPAAAALWSPTHVAVCTPTSLHLEALAWAVEQRCHVLVEKPLAHDPDGVEDVLDAARRAGLCVAVGCNLRFHPGLVAIKAAVDEGRLGRLLSLRAEIGQYLPDWHSTEDYRQSYAARRALGGGALLTLVHELDLAWWIAGPVTWSTGLATRVSDLDIDVDDLVELVCRHEGGAVSSIHADFLDRSFNRRSRWVGSEATVEWVSGGATVLHAPEGERVVLWADPGFSLESTYAAELADFLAASARGQAPRTPAADGLGVLRVTRAVA